MRWLVLTSLLCALGLPVRRAQAEGLAAPSGSARQILILNSYHPQYAWTDALVRGALVELGHVAPEENIHVEYMDARRMLDDAPYLDAFADLLRHKYRTRLPDVILVSDDSATSFLLARRATLFPGVPIVFCGINSIPEAELDAAPGVTGIMEGMEIEGNIRLIERLHPGVRRIVMLADQSSLGRGMTGTARAMPAGVTKVPLEIWDDFTFAELRERMARTGPETAYLMLAIHHDRAGAYFSFAEDLPPLTQVTGSPVYGMFGMLIGTGVVGGLMNDPFTHGRVAAIMVRRVLAGERPDDIPIVPKAIYAPRFDWHVLERFGIPLHRLPADSVIVGRPFSAYESHRTLIWSIAAILVALALATLGLSYIVFRMRRAERELLASYEMLERAQRAEVVGQLAGGVAHDFNNLLTPILLSARFLRRQASGEQAEDLEVIESAAERAHALASQLLSLGRDAPLVLTSVDLTRVLPELLGLMEKSVGTRIALDVEPAGRPLVVEADRCALERVIVNLLVNARDAAAGDRPLRLSVSVAPVELAPNAVEGLAPGSYVRIGIADNGVGMDAATVRRIFEPFFTTKPRGQGAGLGLSTVQVIMRQHGGGVTVESTPGKGSRFALYLRPAARVTREAVAGGLARDSALHAPNP